jgi:hypothetical protein
MAPITHLSIIACGGGGDDNVNSIQTIVGSGIIVQETRDVVGATGVDLGSEGSLTITQGNPQNLVLRTDENIMNMIITEVQRGVLVISSEPNRDIEPSQTIEADLTLNNFDNIVLSGVGDINASDLISDQLELTMMGVGDIEISNLDAIALDVLISGVGDVSISGQVDDQIVTLSSIGGYKSENLSSKTADVEVSNIGSATIRVSASLNVNITGSGSIFYHGSPTINRTGTGSGKVVQLSP